MLNHLEKLRKLIEDEAMVYPCIGDLVSNGLVVSRFAQGEQRPNRQDVTQYLLAWLKSAEVPASAALKWAIPYSLEVLAVLSASSPSRIRHSTKSNVKYIYKSDVPFVCGLEENPFKAACHRECPVHSEMVEKNEKLREEEEKKKDYEAIARKAKLEAAPVYVPKKKEIWAGQFQKAMNHAVELADKGVSHKQIVDKLNHLGFKTRTGRDWTLGILGREFELLK